MLAFVCVRARLREGVCVSPSVCPAVRPSVCLSVCPRACSCVQMFDRTCMHSSMHALVVWHARVREGICLSPSVLPSVRLSVCSRACSCVQMFVRTCGHSSMHARHFLFPTSNLLLLTSIFVFWCLPPYEHVCVCLSVRAYLPECIVCACKHASVRVREGVCVSLSVCPRAYSLLKFVRKKSDD